MGLINLFKKIFGRNEEEQTLTTQQEQPPEISAEEDTVSDDENTLTQDNDDSVEEIMIFEEDNSHSESESCKYENKQIADVFDSVEINESYDNLNSLSGVEFEKVCKVLLEEMGFRVETTKTTGDGGIDLIAHNLQPLLSGKYIVQCKRYSGSVGEPIIRDLYGVVTAERANKGILITTGYFTRNAISFASDKPIELIDGVALKKLFSQYNMRTTIFNKNEPFVDVTQGDIMDNVVLEHWELKNDYEEFASLKYMADEMANESRVAAYINWLLEKNDFYNFILCDFSQRRICCHETNMYIKKYLQVRESEKSKLLSYLYRMIYVQNSILLERFTDAKIMFVEMMKDKNIQFSVSNSLDEEGDTAEIFEHSGVFSFLFATWCNMHQMAFVSGDDELQKYLNDTKLFYGVSTLQNNRIEDSLELIRSGKSNGNARYFQKQQKLIQEIDRWYTGEPIQTKIFFKIDNSEVVKSFYDYAYCEGTTIDELLEFCDYTLEDGKMELYNYGTIDINNALRAYIPLSESDLT